MHNAKGCWSIPQEDQIGDINIPSTHASAINTKAKFQYIACASIPDILSPVQLISSKLQSVDQIAHRRSGKCIDDTKETKTFGIGYIFLPVKCLRRMLSTNSPFGTILDCSSQTGFIMLVANKYGNAYIFHHGVKKYRCITRIIIAAELLALVSAIDNAYIVNGILDGLFDTNIPLKIYTVSKPAFNRVAKQSNSLEKRLQIDAAGLRESYMRREISAFAWIPGCHNLADGLAMEK